MKQLAFAIWYNNATQTLELEKNGTHLYSQKRAGGFVGGSEVDELVSRYVAGQLVELEKQPPSEEELNMTARRLREMVDNPHSCGREQRLVRCVADAFDMLHRVLSRYRKFFDDDRHWRSVGR